MGFKQDDEDLDQANGATHRLTDITTSEVSLVDRAANQRKFLVIKRDTMGKTLVPDGKGGFVSGKGEGDDVQKGTDQASGGANDPKDTDAKSDDKTDAKKDDDDSKAKDDDKSDNADDKTDAKKDDDDPKTKDDKTDAKKDDDKSDNADDDDVSKAGSKMKRARLDKLKSAYSTLKSAVEALSGLLSELDGDSVGKGDDAGKSDDTKNDAGKSDDVSKSDDSKLRAEIDELKSIIKSQSDQIESAKGEIEKLRGDVRGSNSIPVDKVSKGGEVEWPIDMNRPLGKSDVTKNKSFYND